MTGAAMPASEATELLIASIAPRCDAGTTMRSQSAGGLT
jgi:hypothetical protein